MPDTTQQSLLEEINAEIRVCTKCSLHESRTNAVPGSGPVNADIMFVGEAPGFHEDQHAEPFVGASGKYLTDLLAGIGLKRSDVYITNIVRCRPPGNRDPFLSEIEACEPYLERQIQVIKPRIIATLGRFSMAYFLPKAQISKVHGQPVREGGRVFFPLFHPAAALRDPGLRDVMAADFQKMKALIEELEQNPPDDSPPPPKPKQLSLF
ncbi:MAG: uracil-DNA glycosylase [Chloroflexi bacterium]|nr:uracil-DNA glycosylase [Chloroflexota bacterium]